MQAARLQQIDLDYRNHLQAYLNFAVKAQKKSGKGNSRPVFSRFKRFYDYEQEIEKATASSGGKSRFSGLVNFLRKGGDGDGG